jgi:hypothetical protein
MRVIEKQMLNAINQGVNWSKDNTRVEVAGSLVHVYLHNHHIATVIRGSDMVEVNRDTLSYWPTNTTKSRLRALGVNVYTKNHTLYLDDKRVSLYN